MVMLYKNCLIEFAEGMNNVNVMDNNLYIAGIVTSVIGGIIVYFLIFLTKYIGFLGKLVIEVKNPKIQVGSRSGP